MTRGWFFWLFFIVPIFPTTLLDIALIPSDLSHPHELRTLFKNCSGGRYTG